jgi:NAD(P)-dependent dehydrogenase (short-subunit alcohol dehydrogenase family)
VLVTGASSGIGAAIAARLLGRGWEVIGMSRSRPALDGPNFTFVQADLSNSASLAGALSGLEPVDALVHAAGVLRVGRLGETSAMQAQEMWHLHVAAATQMVEHVVPSMPDGGRIVLIGSRVANGAPGRAQYAATKAAMLGLARSWAAELAARGITVNVVAPGATDTPMLRDPGRSAVAPKMPPIGRFVRPEEIAGLVGFLLSEDAGALTGQQIVVCGGASL